jgi:RHS repeat-associated protein
LAGGLADASGSPIASTDHDAFGVVRSQTGASLPLGFTGELTDPTTGFLDLRARDLDPALGRFLSRDTVSPNAPGSQGYNPYAYVANNPTTWTDPSGHGVMPFEEMLNLAFGAEVLTLLAVNPELAGPIVVGIVVAVIFLGIAAILDCTLDTACRARFAHDKATIGQYGSAAAAGAWTLSGQATRYGWQHFPGLPTGSLCLLGAGEGIATNAVASAAGGSHSGASDTTLAAAMGCASGGSSGGGGANTTRFKKPEWVKNPGSFMRWLTTIQQYFKDGGVATKAADFPTTQEVDDIVRLAKEFDVEYRIDPPQGDWGVRHINFGKLGVHLPVPQDYQLPPGLEDIEGKLAPSS